MLRTPVFMLIGLYAPFCGAEYVTDKLVAGLYKTEDANGVLLRGLPSGTPLELLERGGPMVRVRTGDGVEGWIGRDYVTGEKPAQVMLLELQAEMGDLKGRLRQAESALDESRRAPAATPQEASPAVEKSEKPKEPDTQTSGVSKYLLTALTFSLIGFYVGRRFGRG